MFFPSPKRLGPLALALLTLVALGVSGSPASAAKPKPVSVYPAPKTPVASDETTFSFRGLKPKNLGKVRVVGSKTGRVGNTRLRHSDGKGVSLVPKKSFVPGEVVRVYTKKRIKRVNKGDFWVRIGNFYGNEDEGGPGLPIPTDGLNSRPDLKPPVLDVVTKTDQTAPGMYFYAPRREGMTITDSSGRVRWNQPTGFGSPGTRINDFRPQTLNGKPVLTYWKGASGVSGFSQIGFFEILNDRYRRIAKFSPGNGYKADGHEFRLTGRNTALVLAYRGVKWDMTSVGGPTDGKVFDNIVQEIDIKTGAVLFEWHALGNIGLRSSEKLIPEDGSVWDYFHVNSAAADGDSILVSGRAASSLYRIDRRSARVKWRLRGDGLKPKTNSFKLGPGTSFGYQHDAYRLPNGNIALFDNGSGNGYGPAVNEESSGLVLKLTTNNGVRRATLVKRYTHPDGVVGASQGGIHRQPDGNFVVGWGQLKRFTEFTPSGEVAFDATFNSSAAPSYRAYKAKWVGFPKDRPAIASEAAEGGATVWASWNGSTKVTSWKVYTGADAGSLSEAGSADWDGLETGISIPTAGAVVQVAALDSQGNELGRSGVANLGEQLREQAPGPQRPQAEEGGSLTGPLARRRYLIAPPGL